MDFQKKAELMGIEERISKKGNTYKIITLLLGNKTYDFIWNGDRNFDFSKLTIRKMYTVTFEVILGRYTNVNVVNMAG